MNTFQMCKIGRIHEYDVQPFFGQFHFIDLTMTTLEEDGEEESGEDMEELIELMREDMHVSKEGGVDMDEQPNN